MGILRGSGDTQTLPAVINLFELFVLTGGGDAKKKHQLAPSHLVKLSLLFFVISELPGLDYFLQ